MLSLQELVVACCHMSNIEATPLVQMLLYVAHDNLDFSRAFLREVLVNR